MQQKLSLVMLHCIVAIRQHPIASGRHENARLAGRSHDARMECVQPVDTGRTDGVRG